jgi:transposase
MLKRYQNHYEDEARFIICLNPKRQNTDRQKRETDIEKCKTTLEDIFNGPNKKAIAKEKSKGEQKEQEKQKRSKQKKSSSELSTERERKIAKVFEGYKAKYHKFFHIERNEKTQHLTGYRINQQVIDFEEKFDGVFALLTTRDELKAGKVIDSYKNLQEVESFFDDLKHFVDIHPIRHRLEQRVRAHVFLCILALLLKRLFEVNYLKGKSVTEPLKEIEKVKLVRYKVKFSQREERYQIIPKVTTISPNQKKYFNMIGLHNPSNIEQFTW